MSWHVLDLNPATLEAETVNFAYENLLFLKSAAEEKGLLVDALTNPNAQMSTEIAQVRGKLQDVEDDLTVINEQIAESMHYGEHFDIGSIFNLNDYQRWVLCLNDLYSIIIDNKGKWAILRLNNGTPTINDKPIILRGDKIGD